VKLRWSRPVGDFPTQHALVWVGGILIANFVVHSHQDGHWVAEFNGQPITGRYASPELAKAACDRLIEDVRRRWCNESDIGYNN
jgi:hypothetical protein